MNNQSNMPIETQTWIENFCTGKTTVQVGHMMGSFPEGINTQTLEETMALIRNNKNVANFIKNNNDGLQQVTELVAVHIANLVRNKFATAKYYGN